MADKPSPYNLWKQARGDPERYRQLLREHGLLIDRQPGNDGNLLCGWPGNSGAHQGHSTDTPSASPEPSARLDT